MPRDGSHGAESKGKPFLRAFFWVQVPLALTWLTGGFDDAPLFRYTAASPELVIRLKRVPKRHLNATERQAFKRDGVVLVRKVISDMQILAQFDNFEFDWRRSHSGQMLALIRDGPLGALAASALGVSEVRVFEANVWEQPMRMPFGLGSVGNWHQDYHVDEEGRMLPIVSTWLSLSDGARALEFAIGSHKRPVTKFCASPHPWQIYHIPDDCVREAFEDATQAFVFNKGDVAVFQGQLLHQGVNRGEPRLAIAVRWVAARAQYASRLYQSNSLTEYARYLPQECGTFNSRLFPILYPAETSADSTEDWPVIPTLQDVLGMMKTIEDYHAGAHRLRPPCNETWDDGADL